MHLDVNAGETARHLLERSCEIEGLAAGMKGGNVLVMVWETCHNLTNRIEIGLVPGSLFGERNDVQD